MGILIRQPSGYTLVPYPVRFPKGAKIKVLKDPEAPSFIDFLSIHDFVSATFRKGPSMGVFTGNILVKLNKGYVVVCFQRVSSSDTDVISHDYRFPLKSGLIQRGTMTVEEWNFNY